MKFYNKYLGILSFILFISTLFIIYEYWPNSIKEGLTTNISTGGGGGGASSSNIPNSIIPNSVSSVVNDPSIFNNSSASGVGGNGGYQITSSSNVTGMSNMSNISNMSNTANIGNDMNVISQGNANCDPSTAYSIKNVMQDDNGNIIIRYMDTCGKYYTYQYSQTISKVQHNSPPPPPAGPATAATSPPTNPPAAPATNISLNVDSNTINDIIANALKSAVTTSQGTPTPLVYPT